MDRGFALVNQTLDSLRSDVAQVNQSLNSLRIDMNETFNMLKALTIVVSTNSTSIGQQCGTVTRKMV